MTAGAPHSMKWLVPCMGVVHPGRASFPHGTKRGHLEGPYEVDAGVLWLGQCCSSVFPAQPPGGSLYSEAERGKGSLALSIR